MNEVTKGSYDSLVEYYNNTTRPVVDQQLLEAIGGLRFGLKFAAECISQMISPSSSTLTWSKGEVDMFLKLIEEICNRKMFECDDHRQKTFLFKILFRRHGATVIEFCKRGQPELEWLVSDLKDVPVRKLLFLILKILLLLL